MTKTSKKRKKKPKTIVWENACNVTGESLDTVKERPPDLVETYGIIAFKGSKYYIIQTHDSGDGLGNDYLCIPASLVRRVT